jgi:16S rRNA (guanine966-N2)-methyltransferase
MVERNLRACQEIRAHMKYLAAKGVEVVADDSLAYLRGPVRGFNIAFLDPPFESGLLGPCCEYLECGGWLVPGGYVYLEARGRNGLPPLPCTWNLLHSKQAGEVGYYLARKDLNVLEAGSKASI